MPVTEQRLKSLLFALLALLPAGCGSSRPAENSAVIQIGSSFIQIELPSQPPVPRGLLVEWVRRGAVAVSGYLGRFPVEHLEVVIEVGDGDQPIGDGVTYGGSRIEVRITSFVRPADLNDDWVMTHEMFHLAFPTLDHRYRWMTEGLSDYLEPIARARSGQWSAADAWHEFVDNFARGLPEPGDSGLDGASRRDRIYWGGNIYWLLVDLSIRDQTHNKRSLDDAIRAILAAGGNGGSEWPLERVLAIGDKATGTTVLSDWYQKLGPQPYPIDLRALWKKLGIQRAGRSVKFDDTAPWAQYRAAITAVAPASSG